jgi:hypothetical protein
LLQRKENSVFLKNKKSKDQKKPTEKETTAKNIGNSSFDEVGKSFFVEDLSEHIEWGVHFYRRQERSNERLYDKLPMCRRMTMEIDRTRLIEVKQGFNFFGLSHFVKKLCKERCKGQIGFL